MLVSAYTSDLGDENERASGKFEGRNQYRKALPLVTRMLVQFKQHWLLDRLKKPLVAFEKHLLLFFRGKLGPLRGDRPLPNTINPDFI